MAQVGHRVDYLAGFCCPVGGLVAGKPRVLCHENEIYLSNGSEFVYVYDQEGKVLKVSGLAGGALGLVSHGAGVPGQGKGGGTPRTSLITSPVTQSVARVFCGVPHPQRNALSSTRPPDPAPRPLQGAAVWPIS